MFMSLSSIHIGWSSFAERQTGIRARRKSRWLARSIGQLIGAVAFGFLYITLAGPLPEGIRVDSEATAFFQRTNGWVAGDGAISIPLSVKGRTQVLWLFGDSHLD